PEPRAHRLAACRGQHRLRQRPHHVLVPGRAGLEDRQQQSPAVQGPAFAQVTQFVGSGMYGCTTLFATSQLAFLSPPHTRQFQTAEYSTLSCAWRNTIAVLLTLNRSGVS